MTLQETINQASAEMIKAMPGDVVEGLMAANQEVISRHLEDNALKVGDAIPEVILNNHLGEQVNLQLLLNDHHLVISFYRGTWCPYCSLEIKALVDINDQINQKDARLIAISPELADHSMDTIEKENIPFQVLSDPGNKVAGIFGLQFTLPPGLQDIYRAFGFDLEQKNGDNSWVLPMPATYLVSKDGVIRSAFVNADYTQRMEPSDILSGLDKL